MKTRRLGGAALAVLAAFAAVHLATGMLGTLDWLDEGMILAPAWRTGEGQVPYRDFVHIYGPMLFALHGSLLRIFGADLLVLRIALLLVKLALAVEVFLLSRRVAPDGPALLATALVVAVLGIPGVIFTTPYAAFYTLALVLLGILALLGSRGSSMGRAARAGLCFGLAATFKQTTGLFALLAFGLLLVRGRGWAVGTAARGARAPAVQAAEAAAVRAADDPSVRAADDPAVWLERLARATLGLFPWAAVALFLQYTAAGWPSWTTLAVATPVLLCAGAAALAARKRPGPAAVRALGELVAAGAGFAVPMLAVAGAYLYLGGLRELVFDTISGLPQMVHWFVPFYRPPWRVVGFVVAIAGLCALGLAARGRASAAGQVSRVLWPAGWLAIATGVALVVLEATAGSWPASYLRGLVWQTDLLQVLFWIPVPLVLWVLLDVLRPGGAGTRDAAPVAPSAAAPDLAVDRARALLAFQGAAGVLALHPAADLAHVLMLLPLLAPLLADRLALLRAPPNAVRVPAAEGTSRDDAPFAGRAVGRLMAGVVLAIAVATAVVPRWTRPEVRDPASTGGVPLRRATGIWTADRELPARSRLVLELESSLRPDQPFLVVGGLSLLHFLSGRRSIQEEDEMLFYLLRIGLLEPEVVRRLVDEDRLLARLAETGAPVVEDTAGPTAERFRRTLPRVARLLDERYREAGRYGTLRLLRPAS